MQISEAAGGVPAPGAEPCRFPKLEECAHFHYERVQLPQLSLTLQTSMDQSLHSQHTNEEEEGEFHMVQVTSGDACWLIQRNFENFRLLDAQLHQCIYDRKISLLQDLEELSPNDEEMEAKLIAYLERFSKIADNSVNCGPVLNWLQMDNKGHRLLVPSEESRSINTPAVAAAYSVRRYVSQARDELNLEVGDMISVIDMASPGESMWWRGKRGFQVGFFPQHCVHIIGDKVPRNMPLPPPVVGSLALTPIKPVLRKHGKLITFFRSFILNRPSRRRLKQSGILKERVFGCDLGEHLLNSGHDIPTVLKCCAEFIETNGIVDGIYRLSGVTSNIQKLRNAFDEDRVPNLHTEDILQDIHSVASLLKMYFRELPNPLCTYQLYQSFVNAVQGCSSAVRNSETDHERLLKMREAVQKLPPPHYRTLEYLMRHLARVAKHGSSTGMTTRNVAIVWAPNLLRCEALEVGGVAALQGVGVQAVVTEFLICYADLIFCDRLPNLDHPTMASENLLTKKCRPNSLAISTPTKLITLEEARSKHLMSKTEDCNYIEVGGGPKNLPKKYHTIIELPPGARKRGHTKRSPLGWRMFFSKSRNSSQGNLSKNRKATTPITINEKSVTESDLTDMKRKLRSVKSAESLTSGHSEPASTEDVLGPLHCLNKPAGHNRSVSHDSYFDTLQSSQNNSEASLLDLSEIQLNFELEESEMRIFSEDESLVSSPRMHKESQRRMLRARPEDFNSTANSVNPSPKKQPRVVLSPESLSRKRTRLEDQLSDIQYIDCSTPDNVVSTTAMIHTLPESPKMAENKLFTESYQPKNKSPRNGEEVNNKRQSLNLEAMRLPRIPKSFTELDIRGKFLDTSSILTSPAPLSPGYKQLEDSSGNASTDTFDSSPGDKDFCAFLNKEAISPTGNRKKANAYENVLTTINITYKSPPRSAVSSPVKSPASACTYAYENVILNPERVMIPTSVASLPVQEASQPLLCKKIEVRSTPSDERPKSLSAIEDLPVSSNSTIKANLSSSAICNTSDYSIGSSNDVKTLSSNQSSTSNVQYTPSLSSAPYHCIENSERLSPTDLTLSEVVESSTENLTTSQTSMSFPLSTSKNSLSPNVSPTPNYDISQDLLTSENRGVSILSEDFEKSTENLDNFVAFGSVEETLSPSRSSSTNDKRKSEETELIDDSSVYQQVKYFRRSIHEVNAMLDLSEEENVVKIEEKALKTAENNSKFKKNASQSLENLLDTSDGVLESSEMKKIDFKATENVYEHLDFKNNCVSSKTESMSKEEDSRFCSKEKNNLTINTNRFEENYDSLEPNNVHVYENIEGESLREGNVYENVNFDNKINKEVAKSKQDVIIDKIPKEKLFNVRDLTSKFEEKLPQTQTIQKTNESVSKTFETTLKPLETVQTPLEEVSNVPLSLNTQNTQEKFQRSESVSSEDHSVSNSNLRLKKFYEKDSLPPCLRARNLKYQLKTRSLDEDEFNKEFGISDERRQSLEESLGYKTNSLPKTLNLPKSLPSDDGKVSSIHLAHSSENISLGEGDEVEEQKKRERIERYKEERRRILQDKYRSESFKEDKEVLLTRLRIFKQKDEPEHSQPQTVSDPAERPPRSRRKSTRSDDSSDPACDSLEEDCASSKASLIPLRKREVPVAAERKETKPPMKESLKSRAAIFEQNNQRQATSTRGSFREQNKQTDSNHAKNLQEKDEKVCARTSDRRESDDLGDLEILRVKRRDGDEGIGERRRHTFDTRERESDVDRSRRISLESRIPKKEKAVAPYCIKDMKAIFESKSKQ